MKKEIDEWTGKVHCGDVIQKLRQMPEKSVNMVMFCVDEKTECLTEEGWKKYYQLREGEKIATYNIEKDMIEYQLLESVNLFDVEDEELVLIDTTALDICVTKNHRNVVRERYSGEVKVKQTLDLFVTDKILVQASSWQYPTNDGVGSETLAKLIGWIIAEGNYRKRGGIRIGINKDTYGNEIIELLEDNNIPFKHRVRNGRRGYSEIDEFYIPSRIEDVEKVQRYDKKGHKKGVYIRRKKNKLEWKIRDEIIPDKKLNKFLVSLPINEAKALFEGLIDGDGHRRNNGVICFTQKNKDTINWFTILALRLGYSVNVNKNNSTYIVTLTDKSSIGTRDSIGSNIERINYSGKVWCPTVSNGTFIARRGIEGRPFITGNSPPYWGLRDYGDIDTIWGGDPNCEHVWGSELGEVGNSNRYGKSTSEFTTTSVSDDIEDKGGKNGGCYCKKCNSWEGQLGLEPTFNLYISHMVEVFKEIKRVLRDDGSVYLNLGDTYAGSHCGYGQSERKESDSGFQNINDGYYASSTGKPPMSNIELKSKCKIFIPHRVAIALIDDGWIVRNDIVWVKQVLFEDDTSRGSSMPSSVKDRFNENKEFVFFLTKQKKYFFDLDAVRAPYKEPLNRWGGDKLKAKGHSDWDEETGQGTYRDRDMRPNPNGKNPGDCWVVKERSGKHKNEPNVNSPGNRKHYYSKQRIHNINQEKFALYLKEHLKGKGDELDETFGEHKWRHWIRTDDSGASLPTPEDAEVLGEMLDLGEWYKLLTESEYVLVDDSGDINGKNPGDVWQINPKPTPFAHFACYPPKLCEKPIKSSCPPKVCAECGTPYERETERVDSKADSKLLKSMGADKNGEYKGKGKNDPTGYAENPSDTKRSILDSVNKKTIFKGWKKQCDCDTDETEPGIVLDPFAGAGTTCMVAKSLGRRWIGIEISEEYCEIARERIKYGDKHMRTKEKFKREYGEIIEKSKSIGDFIK